VGYNYLNSTLEEGANKGNKLPYPSKHQFIWDATYEVYGFASTLSGFHFSDAYSDNANTDKEDATGAKGKIPAYTVWNFNVGKELYKSGTHSLNMNLAVNNLLNEKYYFRGIDTSPVGRYPAPERSYSIDINYQF